MDKEVISFFINQSNHDFKRYPCNNFNNFFYATNINEHNRRTSTTQNILKTDNDEHNE